MSDGQARSGYLALVLHAHLPFVRHPEHPFFLEEDWYYEALTETYLPLLQLLTDLKGQGVEYRIGLSITPPLMSMLADETLAARYEGYLERLTELCDKELLRTRGDDRLQALARHYRERAAATWATWQRWHGRPLHGFRKLLEAGCLEILGSAATHGYLPLLRPSPEAVRAQVAVGVQCYERHLGRPPLGMWLPECGYFPGLDHVLADHGLRYFVLEAHGVLHATPRPRFGNFAPLFCPESGVAAFARDLETARQVWSRDEGYPGDPCYREFYRDIGYDLPLEHVAPYVQPDGTRKNTGIKYHRITGPGEHKELYDPTLARERAAIHAAHFVGQREAQIARLAERLGRPPVVLAAYDAELFGHWWYEGPWWLEEVLRRSAAPGLAYGLTHPARYLHRHPTQQVAVPAESSWGDRGFHEFWCSEPNAWIYTHLHQAAGRMTTLARLYPDAEGVLRRALGQAARELLLAQSSDWAFIMKTGTMVDYARRRTDSHLRRFTRLYRECTAGDIDEGWLGRIEALDNLFPDLDYRVYA